MSELPTAPHFDDGLVDQVLDLQEGMKTEVKRIGDKLSRALETIVAFANTEGGFLILGIEDPKKAKGRDRVYGIQENPAAVDELRTMVKSRITPALPSPNFIEIGCTLRTGAIGSIVVIRVDKSPAVHSIVADGTWTRVGASNRELVADEITRLAMERGAVSAEGQLAQVPFDILNTNDWQQYAAQRKLTRPVDEAMQHVGLAKLDEAGKLRPTRAAVLLFAEDPGGLLGTKAGVRVFHYKGDRVEHGVAPNLLKPPKSFSGPLRIVIRQAFDCVLNELATGVQMGPLGFEIVQRYPARVILEAITNAVLHRDYAIAADVLVRLFSDRIEIESPGVFPGKVSSENIRTIGSFARNPLVVGSLREFPDPPNLDAGEGVRMMFSMMDVAGLYPPLYLSRATTGRDTVLVTLRNEARPSTWDQVSRYIDEHGSIGNVEVRKIMRTDDTLKASKALREWVSRGVLVIADPDAAKQHRRYTRPEQTAAEPLFSRQLGKQDGMKS